MESLISKIEHILQNSKDAKSALKSLQPLIQSHYDKQKSVAHKTAKTTTTKANTNQYMIDKSLLTKHEYIIITPDILVDKGFYPFYTQRLIPALKAIKKEQGITKILYLCKDHANHIIDNNNMEKERYIYDTYLTMQKWIKICDINFKESIENKRSQAILLLTNGHDYANIFLSCTKDVAKIKHTILSFKNKKLQAYKKPKKPPKPIDTKRIAALQIPKVGEQLSCNIAGKSHTVRLHKELGKGGEAIVYEIDSDNLPANFIAKIYQNKKDEGKEVAYPAYTLDKLKSFCKAKLQNPYNDYIAMPRALLYNNKKECIGFLMQKAQGFPIDRILSGGKMRERCGYGNVTMTHLLKICRNFLILLNYLHSKRVLVGDINPHNIMINTQCEVFLIDCDSYQVGRYPCPVATPDFLHPRHRKNDMKETLRDMNDECYAMSVLLFQILTLGCHPYTCIGDAEREDNAKNMRFVYAPRELGGDESLIPKGAKKFWSRMPKEIQNYFSHTFAKNGKYAKENYMLKPKDWLKVIQKCLKLHDSDTLITDAVPPSINKLSNNKPRNAQADLMRQTIHIPMDTFSLNLF